MDHLASILTHNCPCGHEFDYKDDFRGSYGLRLQFHDSTIMNLRSCIFVNWQNPVRVNGQW